MLPLPLSLFLTLVLILSLPLFLSLLLPLPLSLKQNPRRKPGVLFDPSGATRRGISDSPQRIAS